MEMLSTSCCDCEMGVGQAPLPYTPSIYSWLTHPNRHLSANPQTVHGTAERALLEGHPKVVPHAPALRTEHGMFLPVAK